MASLLRDHTPDAIAQTVQKLASGLSSTSTTQWSSAKCARHILTHITPKLNQGTAPPSRRPSRRRTTMRLVPADETSASAVQGKGGHPFVEVILRDTKVIWDVMAHLFAKWGFPVVVQLEGQTACARAQLVSFLPETTPANPTYGIPILNATFSIVIPDIPFLVFKAARDVCLISDAPPSPPPLPPVRSLHAFSNCAQNLRARRTYAAPLQSVDDALPPDHYLNCPNHGIEISASKSVPSHSLPGQHVFSDEILSSAVAPCSSVTQDDTLLFDSILPASSNSDPGQEACALAVSKLENIPFKTTDSAAGVKSELEIQENPFVGKCNDVANSNGQHSGTGGLEEHASNLYHTNATLRGNIERSNKRRRVFVTDGVEWHEQIDAPHDTANLSACRAFPDICAGTCNLAMSSVQCIQEAIDGQARECLGFDARETCVGVSGEFVAKSDVKLGIWQKHSPELVKPSCSSDGLSNKEYGKDVLNNCAGSGVKKPSLSLPNAERTNNMDNMGRDAVEVKESTDAVTADELNSEEFGLFTEQTFEESFFIKDVEPSSWMYERAKLSSGTDHSELVLSDVCPTTTHLPSEASTIELFDVPGFDPFNLLNQVEPAAFNEFLEY